MLKKSSAAPLLGCSVLIADKNPSAQKPLKDELNSLGVKNIDVASDVQDMMRCLGRGYDLLFLDSHLSDKRPGGSILEELRCGVLPEKTAVFVISGDRGASFLYSLLEHEPDGYIIKPYSPEELSTKVVRCFQKKKALSAISTLAAQPSKLPEALEVAERLEEEYPHHKKEVFKKKIECLLKLRDYKTAETLLEKRLASDPHPWMSVALSKCLIQRDELDLAEQILRDAVSEMPEYSPAVDALAKLLHSVGKSADAYAYFEAMALQAYTSVQRMRFYSGLASQFDKTLEKSIIQKTIDRSGTGKLADPYDYHRLASLYIEEGKEAEAVNVLIPIKNIADGADSDVSEPWVKARMAIKKQDEGKARETLFALLRKIEVRANTLSSSSCVEIAKVCIALSKEEAAHKYLGLVNQNLLGFWQKLEFESVSAELEVLSTEKARSQTLEGDAPASAPVVMPRGSVNGELAKKLKGVLSDSN